jgi:hypothetical protein
MRVTLTGLMAMDLVDPEYRGGHRAGARKQLRITSYKLQNSGIRLTILVRLKTALIRHFAFAIV